LKRSLAFTEKKMRTEGEKHTFLWLKKSLDSPS
jgi:hypothetical protein